ncbi:MAG TPA: DUF4124 domain-containing protein [Candidatus Acidoferrum sp.]|nr:DUF4124 domain-containing protein [Candidatus Acidoferrum sp.]
MTERGVALALGVALLLAPIPAAAEVHRWVGPGGVISYSDRPPRLNDLTTSEPERGPRSQVSLDQVLGASGTRAQLNGLMARLAREFGAPDGRVSARDQAAIQYVVAARLSGDRVFRLVRDDIARHLDGAKLQAKGAWLATSIGRRVAALEQREASVDADARVAAFARTLAANPPSARRRELIERLDWVTGTSDVSAQIVAGIAGSVARAGAAAAPAERRTPARYIENQVAELQVRAAESLRESAVVSLLSTYRDLSDDELELFVTFESSDAGRWYNQLLSQALMRSLHRVFDEAAVAMFKAVPPERWAQPPPPPAREAMEAVKLRK